MSEREGTPEDFARMLGRRRSEGAEPEPTPESASSDTEPIEQTVLRTLAARQERKQHIVNHFHLPGDEAA